MNLYSQVETDLETSKTVCDLRSDTVTRPCDDMRRAMSEAVVGDDVYGEDPTVNHLEASLAEMLDKEAGMFVPSGTQSNLCSVMAHCGRGEEVIVGDQYHIFIDEAAGASVLAGVAMFPINLEEDHSVSAASVRPAIKDDDPHCPISKLLCLENTVHGKAISLETIKNAASAGSDAGLSVHLDGARFFNAVTALGCAPHELANIADTVSVCLSKGLGTPMGSVLTGPKDLIAKARRNRKILGGGMRQAGFAAAAGLFALDNNIKRLQEDHDRAAHLASELKVLNCGKVQQDTNMVFFTPEIEDHVALHTHMAGYGVKIGGQQPKIRMVLHKDVDDAALTACISGFKSFFS
ncbi:MAG: low-specificity L-threonine aldolase [Rhizobiaceae bacterium]|nr:low-specificity L-threonine aldolase [Rhizobiaceae bacterium]